MTVADLFGVMAVAAEVPHDETIAAIRAYPDLDRVEFIGKRGVYRTALSASVEDRQPEVDTSAPADETTGEAPAKPSGKA